MIATSAREAFKLVRTRMKRDMGPLWDKINSTNGYSPFWLLARELFPIAESVGDLIYHSSPTQNLQHVLDNQLSRIDLSYSEKGAMIAQLYRHSLIHQDEPRALYANGVTAVWRLSIGDSENHLKEWSKNARKRTVTLSFDLGQFYRDIYDLLVLLEEKGPKRGVTGRYNSWTFKNISNDHSAKDASDQIRKFYFSTK